jgi:hypothetical protein
MGLGRLTPQYFQASGEATPQAQLPEQFVSNPVATSPLSGHLSVPYEGSYDIRRAPVVSRVPRMNGIRQVYSRGMTAMPIKRLGADGQPMPWNSSFQRNDMGPIRNGQYNDSLYQAGYPGFNLGLSFKVPTLQTTNGGTGMISATPPLMAPVSYNAGIPPYNRATRGTAGGTGNASTAAGA